MSFAHELTRDIVRDSFGPLARIEIERRVAEALMVTDPLARSLIARHLDRAHDPRAFVHAVEAGAGALALGGWAHAAEMYEIASRRARDPGDRAIALVGRGRALLGAGDAAGARSALLEAIDLARSADRPDLHARAALALVGRAGRGAIHDDEDAQVSALREALGHLEQHGESDTDDDDAAALRCDVERELAIALLLTDRTDERSALLGRSLAHAAALRPPRPVTHANALLSMRYALIGGDDELAQRIAHAETVLSMPRSSLDDETLVAARSYLHEDLVRACRFVEAERALVEAERALAAYPHPYWTWVARTWRALSHREAGEIDRAEALAAEALALRPGVSDAAACYGVNLVDIRLQQGRAGEVIGLLRHAVDGNPQIAAYRAVLALCASEAGETELAAASLHWFTDHRCTNLPADTSRMLSLAVLAHTAADLADTDAAAVLEPLLVSYRDQWVLISAYGGGGAAWGPVSHALARLAACAEATRHTQRCCSNGPRRTPRGAPSPSTGSGRTGRRRSDDDRRRTPGTPVTGGPRRI